MNAPSRAELRAAIEAVGRAVIDHVLRTAELAGRLDDLEERIERLEDEW